jgi:hypothetical protein
MDIDTRAKLKTMLGGLKVLSFAKYFLEPVDPVRDGAPTYFEVVHQPMDLGTVEKRLDSYGHPSEVLADLRLIVSNAKLFNSPHLAVFKEACMLGYAVEKKWAQMDEPIVITPKAPRKKRDPKSVPQKKTLLARIKVLEEAAAKVDEEWVAAEREFGDLSEAHAATVAAKDLEIQRLTAEVETLRPLSLTEYIEANYKTLRRNHRKFKRGQGPCLDHEKLGEYILMKAARKAKKRKMGPICL